MGRWYQDGNRQVGGLPGQVIYDYTSEDKRVKACRAEYASIIRFFFSLDTSAVL
jgi:hypothetical protein